RGLSREDFAVLAVGIRPWRREAERAPAAGPKGEYTGGDGEIRRQGRRRRREGLCEPRRRASAGGRGEERLRTEE
ncbi:unnamed protein product, partial [Urochloa humidicola]